MNEYNEEVNSRFYSLINNSDQGSLLKLVDALVKAGEHWAVIGENNSSFLLYKPRNISEQDGLRYFVKGIYVGKLDDEDTFINITGAHFMRASGKVFNFNISQKPPLEIIKKIFFQYAQLYAEGYVDSSMTKNKPEGFIKKTTIEKLPEDLHKLEQILYSSNN